MVVKSGRRHSHDIAVDAFHTGLQQKDTDTRILGKSAGKNATSRARPNYKTTTSDTITETDDIR